jgi:adenosylcobinamide-phosphate synthase
MLLLWAFLLDAALGDPRWMPHPVVLIGRFIAFLDKRLYKVDGLPRMHLWRGALLVLLVLGIVFVAVMGLTALFHMIHPTLATLSIIFLLSTTLAARSLWNAADAIYQPLAAGNTEAARRAVAMVVGRDTETMAEADIARAAVETVAENTVDGMTAPLFYAMVGGLPLALLYKAINTMDSMLGYKNQRYLWFGRAAARLDDAANWLPARLTVPVMLLAAKILRLNVFVAWQAVRRDGQKHPSPNSGLSEALTAGALGVKLGGKNHYGGQVSLRPELFAEGRPAEAVDIARASRLMWVTSGLFLAAGLAVRALILFLLRL